MKSTRLTTARDVRRELARLYGEARAGAIDPATATKLAHVLELLRRAIELDDITKRLDALEQA